MSQINTVNSKIEARLVLTNPYVLGKVIGNELVKGTNDAYQSKRRNNTKNFEHKIAEKMAEIEKHQISLWSYLKFMGAKVRFI